MASPSPAKKRRVDTLIDLVTSTGEDLDTQVTSCLYHGGTKDIVQATCVLERVRRLIKVNHARYALQLIEINLKKCGLKQNVYGIEKGELFQ